jgi:predicted nucleic acid-binding protein
MLRESLRDVPEPRGNVFHDVHIAALMWEHGIPTILTADKGFRRFKEIAVTDPVHGV